LLKQDVVDVLHEQINTIEQMSEEELEDFFDIQEELFDPPLKVHVNLTFEETKMLSQSLSKKGLYIIEEKIQLGSKGRYNFFSYELSDAAKSQLQEVVESERETFKKKYDSVETGYMLKHVKELFQSLDYKINEKKPFHLVIKKENQTRYVIVVHTIQHERVLFEKLDELYKKNQHLSFVVTNESILFGKFKPRLFSWIAEKTIWETITF
jgi:hypothetical protein